MKRNYSHVLIFGGIVVLIVLLCLALLFIAAKADAGVAIGKNMPMHTHTSSAAGGTLNGIAGALVSETVVTTPTTTITITGLDIGSAGHYEFDLIIEQTAPSLSYSLYPENNITPANYYSVWHYAGVSAGAGTSGQVVSNSATVLPNILGASSTPRKSARGSISLSPGGVFTVRQTGSDWHNADNVVATNVFVTRSTGTISNITRLDLVSSSANGIGANSRLRLWRMK